MGRRSGLHAGETPATVLGIQPARCEASGASGYTSCAAGLSWGPCGTYSVPARVTSRSWACVPTTRHVVQVSGAPGEDRAPGTARGEMRGKEDSGLAPTVLERELDFMCGHSVLPSPERVLLIPSPLTESRAGWEPRGQGPERLHVTSAQPPASLVPGTQPSISQCHSTHSCCVTPLSAPPKTCRARRTPSIPFTDNTAESQGDSANIT